MLLLSLSRFALLLHRTNCEPALQRKRQKHRHEAKKKASSGSGGLIDSGDRVAAKVDNDWILCSVVSYHAQEDQYEVEDDDSGDEGEQAPTPKKSSRYPRPPARPLARPPACCRVARLRVTRSPPTPPP